METNPVQFFAVGIAALCGAAAIVLLMRRRPEWSMILWTATLFFTPVWLGSSVLGVFLNALTVMTVLAIFSGSARGLRWTMVDTVMGVLFMSLVLGYAAGNAVTGHIQEALLVWFTPYIWGRLVLSRVSAHWVATCIAVAAIGVSLLAIVEFVTGENIFLTLPGAGSSVWGEQRERAGFLRVEGAFGHSIALGGTLSMAASFVMSVLWPAWIRVSALLLIGVATSLTFSRLGIVGFVLTVLLAVLFLGAYLGRRLQLAAVAILGLALIVALPVMLQIFGEAGAEAEGSAGYRVDLIPLVNTMVPLGVSPAREVLATGEDYWGGFRSIDSAMILLGLRFGLIPLAIVLLLLIILIVSVLRRRATPASIALAAQVPAFAAVALITQYAAFVWFAAGLAVASYSLIATSGPQVFSEVRASEKKDVVRVA